MNKKTIGVLGSGIVGKTLAHGFVKHGYSVMVGTAHPDKVKDWEIVTNGVATVDSFANVAAKQEIVVLAIKGSAAEKVIDTIDAKNLSGKTVIDVTNPIAEEAPQDGVIKFFTDLNQSLMERLQERAPDAHFVKAFSCAGNAFMVDPNFGAVKPTMFICGNNEHAKKDVNDILVEFGWETEDLGKATAARAIEPLCILWCIPGLIHNRWSHAFKLLKKEAP